MDIPIEAGVIGERKLKGSLVQYLAETKGQRGQDINAVPGLPTLNGVYYTGCF